MLLVKAISVIIIMMKSVDCFLLLMNVKKAKITVSCSFSIFNCSARILTKPIIIFLGEGAVIYNLATPIRS